MFGSMVGLGGGFVMVPVLRIVFGLSPALAAGTSLILVVANSAGGTVAYLRQKRVDVKLGLIIAVAGFPGSIIGALLVVRISGVFFDLLFAALLFLLAFDLLAKRSKPASERVAPAELPVPAWRSLLAGFFVGLVSSLFGIGGGVVLMPALLYFSTLPIHAISATSHFAIVLTAPIGLAAHAFQHNVQSAFAIPLALGGLLGGPIGATLSARLQSPALMRLISLALIAAATALALRHFL